MADAENTPHGRLEIRTLAMPTDTNPSGDVFGGWLMSQMDIASGIAADKRAKGRVATVAVTGMTFHRPVYVGDVLCCYVEIPKVGRTSITTHVEAWVQRRGEEGQHIKVTEGIFTFVAIDEDGKPRQVPEE